MQGKAERLTGPRWTKIVAIGIGSNRGDRDAHIMFAISRLSTLLTDVRFSAIHDTAPEGVPDSQPRYLNAAAVGRTALNPHEVLEALLAIERDRGRERSFRYAARTLDLDLLLYGETVIDEPGLSVPHPRLRERRFVLEPLSEVAPWLRDPITGQTIEELLTQLPPAPPAPAP